MGTDMKLGETNEGTIPKQCAKFQNFLPYGSRGCHRLQWQKTKKMNRKKEKKKKERKGRKIMGPNSIDGLATRKVCHT